MHTTTNSFASRVLDNTRHGTTSGFCRRESRNLTMERREYSVCVREAVIRVGNRRIMRCIRVWIGNERVSRATRWAMRQHMYDGKSGENGWPVSWIVREILFFFFSLLILGYVVCIWIVRICSDICLKNMTRMVVYRTLFWLLIIDWTNFWWILYLFKICLIKKRIVFLPFFDIFFLVIRKYFVRKLINNWINS